jgi:imidazolonepropionase-like amidohydrolase
VIRSATLNGAELLGMDSQIGTVEAGKKADLVLVQENPLANFKVLYGTGTPKLNEKTDEMERSKGIRYTIKDGIVYDAPMMLAQVRALVAKEKEREAAAKAPD